MCYILNVMMEEWIAPIQEDVFYFSCALLQMHYFTPDLDTHNSQACAKGQSMISRTCGVFALVLGLACASGPVGFQVWALVSSFSLCFLSTSTWRKKVDVPSEAKFGRTCRAGMNTAGRESVRVRARERECRQTSRQANRELDMMVFER